MATAGRAITFSGLTVAVGLSAMLFFQGTFLASMGAAGAIVVAVAVIYGLTFLPALLSIIGPAGKPLRPPSWLQAAPPRRGVWHPPPSRGVKRPLPGLVPPGGVLLVAGT